MRPDGERGSGPLAILRVAGGWRVPTLIGCAIVPVLLLLPRARRNA